MSAPELPHGWHWDEEGQNFVRMFGKKTGFCVSQTALCELLASRGLRIVTEKDAAVLEASGKVHQCWLESYVNIIVPTQADPQAFAWARAELARREALHNGERSSSR